MGILLKLEAVAVSYGGVAALHPLTLSVMPGEFFCLLGPSGCGKTTTLGVIAGFFAAQHGRVVLGDEDVTSLTPQNRRIGVVFQNYALFPHMTAAENIGYGLRLQKRDKAEVKRRVEELLGLVHLTGKGNRFPRQLSGGEQQRVAIARALAIEPRLLLMDEPLSNLDARLREEMRDELKRIQRETGVTTVFVTHDQEEAFGIGDRVAVLNKGRLEQIGTPRDIYREPESLFVAQFIGRSNRFAATKVAGEKDVIDINGHRFACDRAARLQTQEGVLFLRPEEISLGNTKADLNSVPATVIEVIYGGALVNYRLQTQFGVLDVCRILEGTEPLPKGSEVHANWSPSAGALLADHDATE